MVNILAAVGTGAANKATELIDDRAKRRQDLVDGLSVKFFDTVQKAKGRHTTEKAQVAKAVAWAKQNGIPRAILEDGIMKSGSPDNIYSSVVTLGTQWGRAKTDPVMRGRFGGDDSQYSTDHTSAYDDEAGVATSLTSSSPGEAPVGSAGGFGTSVPESATNGAFKAVGDLAGMKPEEVAGYVRNTPTAGSAGENITGGQGLRSDEEIQYGQKAATAAAGNRPSVSEVSTMAAKQEKIIANEMGLDATIGADGQISIGAASAQKKAAYAERVAQANADLYEMNGYPDVARAFLQSLGAGKQAVAKVEGGATAPVGNMTVEQAVALAIKEVGADVIDFSKLPPTTLDYIRRGQIKRQRQGKTLSADEIQAIITETTKKQ